LAMNWMGGLTLLLFWLPVFGPLIGGAVGGWKAGSPKRALVAVFLPGVLLGILVAWEWRGSRMNSSGGCWRACRAWLFRCSPSVRCCSAARRRNLGEGDTGRWSASLNWMGEEPLYF